MGTLMFWSMTNNLFKQTLERMKPLLQTAGYIGYTDINCIVNGKGIYPLEFTNRFGYPTISVQVEGIMMSVGEFLFRLSNKETFEIKTKRGFQIGVVVGVPPFPYHDANESEIYDDLSIIFKKPSTEGIHLGDVKFVEGDWRLAGGSGYALVVTGSGTTVAEARKLVYNRIDNIILQNKFYRTDIGLSWGSDSDKLQTWGYL
jgi:phosphoribosylamine--glycine ligase